MICDIEKKQLSARVYCLNLLVTTLDCRLVKSTGNKEKIIKSSFSFLKALIVLNI